MTPLGDALGGYHPLDDSTARWLGSAVFLGMLALTAVLERLQFQLRATEAATWWASNGRDVVNLFALAAMTLGLRFLGFTGPISLALASTIVLLLSALQTALERHPHVWRWNLLLALALGAPVLLAPRAVHRLFRGIVEGLFA